MWTSWMNRKEYIIVRMIIKCQYNFDGKSFDKFYEHIYFTLIILYYSQNLFKWSIWRLVLSGNKKLCIKKYFYSCFSLPQKLHRHIVDFTKNFTLLIYPFVSLNLHHFPFKFFILILHYFFIFASSNDFASFSLCNGLIVIFLILSTNLWSIFIH